MSKIKQQKRSYRKRSELTAVGARVHGLSKWTVGAVRAGHRKNDQVLGTLLDYNKWKEDAILILQQKQELYKLLRERRKAGINAEEEVVLKLEDEIDDLQSYFRFKVETMIEVAKATILGHE